MKTERYEHHGVTTTVVSEVKGKHRNHCLCFSCEKFEPINGVDCPIAKTVYATCIDYNLVTPVYECPSFVEKEEG